LNYRKELFREGEAFKGEMETALKDVTKGVNSKEYTDANAKYYKKFSEIEKADAILQTSIKAANDADLKLNKAKLDTGSIQDKDLDKWQTKIDNVQALIDPKTKLPDTAAIEKGLQNIEDDIN
jgi:hypothetical protein